MRTITAPNGPLEQFKISLERLASKAGKALVWPFQKGEVNDVLVAIERQKSCFILAQQNDHMYEILRFADTNWISGLSHVG
jgi:hypothetical protein